jgi:hypothetical protein
MSSDHSAEVCVCFKAPWGLVRKVYFFGSKSLLFCSKSLLFLFEKFTFLFGSFDLMVNMVRNLFLSCKYLVFSGGFCSNIFWLRGFVRKLPAKKV